VAVLLGVVTTLTFALAHLPSLGSAVLRGDDYALVLHSAAAFNPSPLAWVTRGFDGYFVQVPEIAPAGTNFIRPVVNATVYLDSVIFGTAWSPWFLTLNYVGHGAAVALTYLVARRLAALSVGWAVVAGTVFAGTTSTHGLFTSVAFRGDMLAAVFGASTLLLTDAWVRGRRSPGVVAGISLLAGLAMFAKEAAVAVPVAAGAWWLFSIRDTRPERLGRLRGALRADWPLLAALAVPLAGYAAARLGAGLSGTYAVDDLPGAVFGIPIAVLNPLRFVATAFVPIPTDTIKAVIGGSAGAADVVRLVVTGAVNAACWLAIAWLVWRRRERSVAAMLTLGIAASAVPIVIKADPRFMYLAQTLLVPLVVGVMAAVSTHTRLPRRSITAAVVGLLVLTIGVRLAESVAAQPRLVAANRAEAELQGAVRAELARASLERLYLVNVSDQGQAMLDYFARRQGRDDVVTRVLTTMSGSPRAGSGGSTTVTTGAGRTRIVTRYGRDQAPFGYVTEADVRRLTSTEAARYELTQDLGTNPWGKQVLTQRVLAVSVPAGGDYAIVGFDPGAPDVHVYSPVTDRWAPTSS
jgi:hypothetical protein